MVYCKCCGCITCFRCFESDKKKSDGIVFLTIGINNTGKTTFLHRMMNDKVEEPTPTWGFTTETVKFKKRNITLYDVGGSPSIRGIWVNYYAETYGIIFFIDVSDEECITQSKEILETILKDEKLKDKPILIFANKVDKIEKFEYMETYNKLNIESLISQGITSVNKILLYPCSSLLINKERDPRIDSGLEWLITRVNDDRSYIENKVKNDTKKQNREFILEQEEKQKRVEEYKKLRAQQEVDQKQQEQLVSNTTNNEEIPLISKDKSKSRSVRSVKVYPEEILPSPE
ncbi:P-loop containing nucleoside triphosphate hydrolase protein [Anaeromyces robustus]|uniref:p-loop containing nucleoside triphosphate hydrolase protein n=1 Tax=Anaeromyces robustus TaxID=1754192 RepID=A0A1Y1WQ83_9FUNG|nr:P-loop containing nucleoside triphosphate hydrolase protein [Anaeromyces robustus]|eukprot:ORX75416.1 P-loop containing nucleoside triphosphate hydrolase protein [Anaeromyces robustus]